MASLHGDQAWRSYDESFRRLKESVNLPWQKTVDEFRIKAATLSSKVHRPQSFPSKNSSKTCFVYNKGEKCKFYPCNYSHSCSNCKGNHPKAKCRLLRQTTKDDFPNKSTEYQKSKVANPSQFRKA